MPPRVTLVLASLYVSGRWQDLPVGVDPEVAIPGPLCLKSRRRVQDCETFSATAKSQE